MVEGVGQKAPALSQLTSGTTPASPTYLFKANLDNHPNAAKKRLMEALGADGAAEASADRPALSQEPRPRQPRADADTSQARTQATNKYSKKLSKFGKENSIESTSSSAEKRRQERQFWPPKHDHLFEAEPYLMRVATHEIGSRKLKKVYIEDRSVEELQASELPLSLARVSQLENELSSMQNIQDLFERLDQRIDRKRQQYFDTPEEPKEITSQFVRWRAQLLYSALKGLDGLPTSQEDIQECQKLVLDVFKLFPEDPLANESVWCPIRHRYPDADGDRYASRAAIEGKKPEREPCSHTYKDDVELQKRYRLQLWYLNFCKYLRLVVLSNGIRQEELKVGEEEQVPDTQAVEDMQKRMKDIQKLPGGTKKVRKASKTQMACDNIVKNLVKQADAFTDEERAVLKDFMTAKALLESPMLKIIEVELQDVVLDYKVHHGSRKEVATKTDAECRVPTWAQAGDRDIFETEQHFELFLNETVLRVIKHFQDEAVQVKRKKHVTFKNAGRVHDALFNGRSREQPGQDRERAGAPLKFASAASSQQS